jgi:hypothetical protein
VWADALRGAEHAHILQLLLWGGASAAAGLLLLLTVGRLRRSPLVFHFAAQCVVWGAVVLVVAASALRSLQLRDLAAATRLDRLLWLNLGFETGYVAVGATIALCAWLLGRRHGGVGAGLAIMVQGLGLAVITARLLLILEQFV